MQNWHNKIQTINGKEKKEWDKWKNEAIKLTTRFNTWRIKDKNWLRKSKTFQNKKSNLWEMNLFYLHVSESPRMNPVKLVVRKVSQNQKLEVLQNANVQSSDRRSWDVKISKRRQIAKRPLRNVFDVAAVDLEQLQLPESDDPWHGHDLWVFDAEDRQLAQEVDRVRRQALQGRLLDVDLALWIGTYFHLVILKVFFLLLWCTFVFDFFYRY